MSESSRESAVGAGWRSDGTPGDWTDLLHERVAPRWTEFSWLAVRSLLDSANDTVAKNVHDLVNARRMRWVAAQRAAGADPDMHVGVVAEDVASWSFLLVGDPGEADASQYALVEALKAKAKGTDFMLLASDVIYPAGDVNDYENAFFLPYWWYGAPILGQPGNHDWYDGLAGFMWHFCGAEPLPPLEYRAGSFTTVERVARRLWRRASRPNRARLLAWRSKLASQDSERWVPPQPGPYFSLETKDLKVIVIDTGITGAIDREQGDWLLRESQGTKAKLLITGKPIYVNNEYHPGEIIWDEPGSRSDLLPPPAFETVDDVVRDPERNFVAAIGGDTHSYQRYSVATRPLCEGGGPESERRIEYIVSGGGGAYMSATHKFGRVHMAPGVTEGLPPEVQPVGEADFRCYPLRGDSVAYYVRPLGVFLKKWIGRSLLALAAVGGAVLAGPTPFHGLSLGDACLGVLGTLGGLALLAAIFALARRIAPRSYGFFCGASATAAALLGGLWGLDHAGWWDDAWVMVPATLAVLLVPLAAVLVGYYTRGASPRFVTDLVTAVVVAAAIVALAGWEPWTSAGGLLAAAAGALAGLAVVVPVLGALRRGYGRRYRRWVIRASLLLAGLGVWQAWEHWPVRAVVVAAGVVLVLLVLAFLCLIVGGSGAWWPLLCRDFSDPTERADAILKLVHERLGLDPLPRPSVAPQIDGRSRRLVEALLANRGKRVLDPLISEAADQNAPPLFKQFLRLDVRDRVLRIECWGVTGWSQDAADPPLEDWVEVPLTGAGA